eukprot:13099058-Ditylum_brightwellii.AAC.1
MDCMQLFQLSRAVLSNDAESSHNRMIPEVTAMHLQALGLPQQHATETSVLFNHNAKHYVKTAAGVSK